MAPAYKLTYFNSRGISEPIRYLFKYGNIEFEDVRITHEEWPQFKDDTPFGQLPVLEHNGKKMGQSLAIARYVAKQVKLAGNDDWENLEIDAIVDTFNDLRSKLLAIYRETDEDRKQTLKEIGIKETIPYYMKRFDELVKKNNGHLVLGRLTWADLYFVSYSPNFTTYTGSDIFKNYPNLANLIEKVHSIPAIKEWIETRPQTEK